jgi:two-component system LytT family response regulator
MLNACEWIQVIGESDNGQDAVTVIRRESPDVVFLEIELPRLGGIELARALTPTPAPMLVFVTAFERYAAQAFDVSAVDFVLKPVAETRLAYAVERVLERYDDLHHSGPRSHRPSSR